MSAPLQSKNDIDRIEPFKRNIEPPKNQPKQKFQKSLKPFFSYVNWDLIFEIKKKDSSHFICIQCVYIALKVSCKKGFLPIIVGITGCILRASASGNVIDMVKTDPRLVPTHNVGNNVDGSIKMNNLNNLFTPFRDNKWYTIKKETQASARSLARARNRANINVLPCHLPLFLV